MKKKAIQTLVFLNSRQGPKIDSSNVHQSINQLPKAQSIDLKESAKRYADAQLESSYGIRVQQPTSRQDKQLTQQIMNKINEIRKAKSIRLAAFIQKIGQGMNYEQLQEARQLIQALNNKQVKELSFTLDVLQKVVNSKLEREEQLSQNHTVASAMSLIQELKKAKKIHQL